MASAGLTRPIVLSMAESKCANGVMSRRHGVRSTRVVMTAGPAESTTVMELLQDISSRLARLEDKVEHIAERMEDLMDDYHPDHDVKYPR